MKAEICIMGAGAFGKAIAHLLTEKGYGPVIWTRGMDAESCVKDKDFVIFAVPAQSFREVFSKAAPYIGNAIIINVAKGIETGSLLRLSQVAEEILPGCRYAVLSGPSHAEEIAIDMPTDVSISSNDPELLPVVQDLFFAERFRVYTNNDLIGVELGGSVKNVIALATGIADGLGFGDNSRAALMTRGLAEISRLGIAMGADPVTFLGLAGVGDLIVTCGSMHSRNRRCGILLGQGKSVEEATREVGQVVEGISTCCAVYELAQKYSVDMPITSFLYHFLTGKISLEEALNLLLSRDRKAE